MINTKNLRMEKMKIEDVYQFRNWSKHTEKLYDDYNFYEASDNAIKDWYKWKTENSRSKYFTIFLEDRAIGYISFKKINKITKSAVLGVVLDPGTINKGYGTEALFEMLKYFFYEMKFEKMYLDVAEYNYRAITVYKKLGFKKYKTLIMAYPNENIDFDDERYIIYNKHFFRILGKLFFYANKMILDRNTFDEVVKCISN